MTEPTNVDTELKTYYAVRANLGKLAPGDCLFRVYLNESLASVVRTDTDDVPTAYIVTTYYGKGQYTQLLVSGAPVCGDLLAKLVDMDWYTTAAGAVEAWLSACSEEMKAKASVLLDSMPDSQKILLAEKSAKPVAGETE